jgi:hypothetical protein
MTILERSEAQGGPALDKMEEAGDLAAGAEATEEEALAVARAIGLSSDFAEYRGFRREADGKDGGDGEPLAQVASTKSDYTSGPESPSPTGELTLDESMAQESSPRLPELDSAASSDDDGQGDGDRN